MAGGEHMFVKGVRLSKLTFPTKILIHVPNYNLYYVK